MPFFAINAFALVVMLAVIWRNRAETHKRLMLLSNGGILPAAIARIPFDTVQAAAPFISIFGPDLIIAAGITYDWLSRRRLHKVWLIGGAAMIGSQLLMLGIMGSEGWKSFAAVIDSLS